MPVAQKLWKISLTTSPAVVEAMATAIEDEALAVTIVSPPRSDKAQIEALYGEKPALAAINAKLSIIAILHGTAAPKIEGTELPKLDWLKKVAADFPPLAIARWTIHGAGHRKAVPRRHFALQIDATNAFGTGEHPTTKGCLLMLDWLLKKTKPQRMLDVGCGSGILAMGYAQACRGKAIAIDLDPDSIQIAKHNLRVNGLQAFVLAEQGFGYRSPSVRRHRPYDLIMANIFARPLSEMAKNLSHHLTPGGIAILSGLLNDQANRVLAAHRIQGLFLVKHLKLNGWSVLALKRPTKA